MPSFKYFDKIIAAQTADASRPAGPLPPFEFASLANRSALARWLSRLLLRRILPLVTAVLRVLWPNPRFGRFVIVTRRSDVEAVLGDMANFPVVYALEMKELAGGTNNVLALDGEAHDRLLAALHRSVRRDDVERIARIVREDAALLLDAGKGRIDVIRDLVTRTATEASSRLFGLTIEDPDRFAEWTMAVSTQLFGDFFGDPNIRRQATTASAHLLALIDSAIDRVEYGEPRAGDDASDKALIDRLLDQGMPRDQVRATILGLATAFVPTNTLAAGNILEELMSRPELMRSAGEVARSGDRKALQHILLQAGRRNPALSPGLWRHRPENSQPATIGTGRGARETRAGDLILACIPSALRERTGHPDSAALMFGYGPHFCFGDQLAMAHLVSVFEALLAQEGLRRAPGRHGRMYRIGAFPTRLDMTYRAETARRAMMVLSFPVRSGVERGQVQAALDALGNPANPAARAAFDRVGRVQFASLSVIERAPGAEESILLFEISGDGEDETLIRLVAREAVAELSAVFCHCVAEGVSLDSGRFEALLRSGYHPLQRWPWGATGLHFDGLPELSVANIDRQERVAHFAASVVEGHLAGDLGLSTRAMDILRKVRRRIRHNPPQTQTDDNRVHNESAALRAALLKPGRQRLALAEWKPSGSIFAPLPRMLLAQDNRVLLIVLASLWSGWAVLAVGWLYPISDGWVVRAIAVLAGLIAGTALALVSAAMIVGAFATSIRFREKREAISDQAPARDHVSAVTRRENAPGHAQNHILAVMPFKPGVVRRLSFSFVMWGILQSVRYWFRPGFVVTMGTIHKARWLRVPGTNQFVFLSNFDGSWESYLEDFITRAHEGQTAAWSHGVGFPKTRYLILDGARDGDRFKRWVRAQQRESRFWYSRFPALTAQQIRRNAMIEEGLARASSDTDARRWLAQFGSAQRGPEEIEAQEGQTLIFSGFPRQEEATSIFLRLPAEPRKRANWLKAVTGLRARPLDAIVGPPERWLTDADGRKDGSRSFIELPMPARVRFGDVRVTMGGCALGFTAAGLELAGLSEDCGLESFPPAFRSGMAQRAAGLGDDPSGIGEWRFSDDPADPNAVHAVLMIYGHEISETHDDLVSGHLQLLNHFGGRNSHIVPCSTLRDPDGHMIEHFGFRDGISQPVMRGTGRATSHVPQRDLLPPGEFLLGYDNIQGYVAPPITVGPEHDPGYDLPAVSASDSDRYPQFGKGEEGGDIRDFSRNGSFLAIRQLDQNVVEFHRVLADATKRLRESYPGLVELAGGEITEDWLAAKIIGRWKDGTPLVGHPIATAGPGASVAPENDFAFGVDDPRGFACPLGSHIRRANPRDSLEPGDSDEQKITNRHRLLRRGRTYDYEADGEGHGRRRGLLFAALCSDLERQFEFVQRTWINATSFHGLVQEYDPLMGGAYPGGVKHPEASRAGAFTIPTAAGPARVRGLQSSVSMHGGGYFFLPSRSAFAFLINRSFRATSRNGGATENVALR